MLLTGGAKSTESIRLWKIDLPFSGWGGASSLTPPSFPKNLATSDILGLHRVIFAPMHYSLMALPSGSLTLQIEVAVILNSRNYSWTRDLINLEIQVQTEDY